MARHKPTRSEMSVEDIASVSSHDQVKFADLWLDRTGLEAVYEPPEPYVEIIFVHSLWGGSRRSWMSAGTKSSFWPQDWLRTDRRFKSARISVYGYLSDYAEHWVTTGKVVPDHMEKLAVDFLDQLMESKHLNDGSKTSIILVGHGIGGIVNKKLYMLAKSENSDASESKYQYLAERVRALVFLATPHQPTDLPKMLTAMYTASMRTFEGSDRPSSPNSVNATKKGPDFNAENERFIDYMHKELIMCSFYQNEPDKVEQSWFGMDKATLSSGNEIGIENLPFDGNFMDITHFKSPKDKNYQKLVDVLAKLVQHLEKDSSSRTHEEKRAQLHSLENYLDSSDTSEGDFDKFVKKRSPGTCEWMLSDVKFRSWLDAETRQINFLWLKGPPTAGKSVASAHVISSLQASNKQCYYFFFSDATGTPQNLSSMLCSIALQMAKEDRRARKFLRNLEQGGVKLEHKDPSSIWRKLFVDGILGLPFREPQFWIIDSIDHCDEAVDFLYLLQKNAGNLPLRIFVSTRNVSGPKNDFHQKIEHMFPSVLQITLEKSTTRADIETFLRNNSARILAESAEDRDVLIKKFLKKSEGSFLWASLTLDRLITDALDRDDVDRIMNSLPHGLAKYYETEVKAVTLDQGPQKLLRHVLPWVICGMRSMKIDELKEALLVGSKGGIIDIEGTLEKKCRQLIRVNQSKEVEMIHSTAREYFLRDSESSGYQPDNQDAIARRNGLCDDAVTCHRKLAVTCLDYLSSKHLSIPRFRSRQHAERKASPFAAYACVHFFSHLQKIACDTDSETESAFEKLLKFLRSSQVLGWIEYLFREKGQAALKLLIDAARFLHRTRREREAAKDPQIDAMRLFTDWAVDLTHLVTRFGQQLLNSPSSIFFLIPALCPAGTAIHRQFGNNKEGLIVSGVRQTDWEDRLAQIRFDTAAGVNELNAIAARDSCFVLGLSDGQVIIYDDSSCHQIATISDPRKERVIDVQFGRTSNLLAVARSGWISVYVSQGLDTPYKEALEPFKVAHEPLALSLSYDDKALYVVTKGNLVYTIDLECPEDRDEPRHLPSLGRGVNKQPSKAAFSATQSILAVEYRGEPILLWDMEENRWMKHIAREKFAKGRSVAAQTLAFNPDEDKNVLLGAFLDDEVIIFDITGSESSHRERSMSGVNASHVAFSADGKKLACVGTDHIRIYDFEDLDRIKLIYSISCNESVPSRVCFGRNGDRIYDMRKDQCDIWEPTKFTSVDSNFTPSEVSSTGTEEHEIEDTGFGLMNSKPVVSVMAFEASSKPQSEGFVFYGTRNGKVAVRNISSLLEIDELYSHSALEVIKLVVQDDYIASADEASWVIIHQRYFKDKWKIKKTRNPTKINGNSGGPVKNLLFNNKTEMLAILQQEVMIIVHLSNGQQVSQSIDLSRTTNPQLLSNPMITDNWFIFNAGDEAYIYPHQPQQSESRNRFWEELLNRGLTTIEAKDAQSKRRFYKFCYTFHQLNLNLQNEDDDLHKDIIHYINHFLQHQLHTVGVSGEKLVFLNWDRWICTIDLHGFREGRFERHFFLPLEWVTPGEDSLIQVTPGGKILVGKGVDVVVVENGLLFGETVLMQRPSSDDSPGSA